MGDLTLDERTREVRRSGERLDLASREFALLRCLMSYAGQLMTREQIIDRIWRHDVGGTDIVETFMATCGARSTPAAHR